MQNTGTKDQEGTNHTESFHPTRYGTGRETSLRPVSSPAVRLVPQGVENVYDHEVSIHAQTYLPVDETSIPTGQPGPTATAPQSQVTEEEEEEEEDEMMVPRSSQSSGVCSREQETAKEKREKLVRKMKG